MPRAPLIGVTTSVTPDDDGGPTPHRAHLNRAYVLAVQRAGGVPVLLPPYLDEPGLNALWERLDGLVLTGGGDVAPQRFGEARHPTADAVSEARDALELDVAERALHQGRPLLAICRGVQVLNVALGGSLHQHIPDVFPQSAIEHAQREPRSQATHPVKVMVEGTPIGAILGTAELNVNSFHHQAIHRLGRGLRDVAWAPDGVIEAVDGPANRGFVIGVQWHPEDLIDRDPAARNLFTAFVTAARRH
jgi:putative glutamine amidotransferase